MPNILPEGHYVYAYYEQGKAEPFYIGKGSDDRAWQHLEANVLIKAKTRFHKKLRGLMARGETPEIEILSHGLSESEALYLEICLIRKFGRKDIGTGILCNATDGGDSGVKGFKHSEATKKIIREKRALQAPLSKEARRQLSEKNKGNKYALGHIMPTRRPIIAKWCVLEFKRYDYIAQVKEDGYCPENVGAVLRGLRPEAHGLEWEYLCKKST